MEQSPRPAGADLLALVDLLYAVCDDLGRWPVFLRRLTRATGAKMAVVHEIDLDSGCDLSLTAFPPDAATRDRYNRRFGRGPGNPWLTGRATAQLALGRVFAGRDGPRAASLQQTPFYEEFLEPLGVLDHLTVVFDVQASHTCALSLLVAEGAEPPGADARSLLAELVPHLRRALRLSGLLAGARRLQLALEDTVERVPIGMLLFDRDGRLVLANGRARRLLGDERGLLVDQDGRPSGESPEVTAALRGLLDGAATQVEGEPRPPARQLLLPRARGRRPLSALVAPVSAGPRADPAAFAALFLSDPEERLSPRAELLQQRCGLTPTEARVAAMMVQGNSVEEVAAALDSSLHTVRTHLKRIFNKTGTHRQASLVSLLVNAVGALDMEVN